MSQDGTLTQNDWSFLEISQNKINRLIIADKLSHHKGNVLQDGRDE